jgi:hypothetical protein
MLSVAAVQWRVTVVPVTLPVRFVDAVGGSLST